MERIFRKARSFKPADEWDVRQHSELSRTERQRIARELKRRVYGNTTPDVRAPFARHTVEIEPRTAEAKVVLHLLGLSSLLKNRESSRRPKDLEDLRCLRHLQ